MPNRPTQVTRARYQRIAPIYDFMEITAEYFYAPWRRRLWSRVRGPRVLEVGVGTGKNMPYYPPGLAMTGVDLTPGMLARARRRAGALSASVELQIGDAQALEFADDEFDAAVATFVFCSIPDPLRGLSELARVVRPGGQVLLLEHVRAANAILGALMDIMNPVVVRAIGANINRRTVENVQRSPFIIKSVTPLGLRGIYNLIEAAVPL